MVFITCKLFFVQVGSACAGLGILLSTLASLVEDEDTASDTDAVVMLVFFSKPNIVVL